MEGYLVNFDKTRCFGCSACAAVCPKKVISMERDEEGFYYPKVGEGCIDCGLCHKACPAEAMPRRFDEDKLAFGGYVKDAAVREESTSGGAFSALATAFYEKAAAEGKQCAIFGAESKGIQVFHSYITDIADLYKFRKSKYSQSVMGDAYAGCKKFLLKGHSVLFSGTPCQIAGLKAFLRDGDYDGLLTVEVICEGVPTPHYMEKYDRMLEDKHGAPIRELDYRYTDATVRHGTPVKGKWDFQVMHTVLENGTRVKTDRWFNPFWSIWLSHLMSRPSCYACPFTTAARVADVTLGDLWGVHLYCPELYGKNLGASLIVCNTQKGKDILSLAKKDMYGHELDFATALKYQSPMRRAISVNPDREDFMRDVQDPRITYTALVKKWGRKPTCKLLWQKYAWGNRQKIAFWNLKQGVKKQRRKGDDA